MANDDHRLSLTVLPTPLALASARVPLFSIATHDTDYLLVPQAMLATASDALTRAGHVVRGSERA